MVRHGAGAEVDLYAPHWHGTTVDANCMRTDVVDLLPMSMVVADMSSDSTAAWLFHGHVNDHIIAGTQARFAVEP